MMSSCSGSLVSAEDPSILLSSMFSSPVIWGEATPDFPFAIAGGLEATPRLPSNGGDGGLID